MKSEITGVIKIQSNDKYDTFEYRDMYNDTQTITFPKNWYMTIEEVEEYLSIEEL